MGFLDKLFGNTPKQDEKQQAKPKVRAMYRDIKYFEKGVSIYDKFIVSQEQNQTEFLLTHKELKPAHYLSSVGSRMNKLECKFSKGDLIKELQPIFKESIENFSQAWSEDYQGYPLLLQMISLGILLEVPEAEHQKIKEFIYKAHHSTIEAIWKPDNLIFFLMSDKEHKRKGSKSYEKLYEITQLPKLEAEKAIKDYLEVWYSLHQADPWYNTHLRDWGYSGYWAWEVAAVVKVMKLNDSGFKDNPYYPYDMVHWEK